VKRYNQEVSDTRSSYRPSQSAGGNQNKIQQSVCKLRNQSETFCMQSKSSHHSSATTVLVSIDSKFLPHITSIIQACQHLHKPIRKSSKNIAPAHSFHFQPDSYQLQSN